MQKTNLDFKYIVKGDHPIFRRIDRRCLTLPEAENVKDGLEAVGYEIKIEPLKKKRILNNENLRDISID